MVRGSTVRKVMAGLLSALAALAIALVLFLRLPWIATETVSFRNGDITLVGTLATPRWSAGPYPAAVIVQGSATLPRWIYWSYVRHLVPHGMAVLIYDKRGTGASSGAYPQPAKWSLDTIANCRQFLETLARDAMAGVELLRARPEIDSKRVGLAGISQAGWIMPLAAAQGDNVAFIVSISGPAVSCGLEDWYSQLTGEYAEYAEFEGPVPYAPRQLSAEEIEQRLDAYTGPVGYDPVPVLSELNVPILWILGGRDQSVPTARSVANLEALVDRGAPFEIRVYPEGNHVLARGDGDWPRIDYWPDVRDWLERIGMLTSK